MAFDNISFPGDNDSFKSKMVRQVVVRNWESLRHLHSACPFITRPTTKASSSGHLIIVHRHVVDPKKKCFENWPVLELLASPLRVRLPACKHRVVLRSIISEKFTASLLQKRSEENLTNFAYHLNLLNRKVVSNLSKSLRLTVFRRNYTKSWKVLKNYQNTADGPSNHLLLKEFVFIDQGRFQVSSVKANQLASMSIMFQRLKKLLKTSRVCRSRGSGIQSLWRNKTWPDVRIRGSRVYSELTTN